MRPRGEPVQPAWETVQAVGCRGSRTRDVDGEDYRLTATGQRERERKMRERKTRVEDGDMKLTDGQILDKREKRRCSPRGGGAKGAGGQRPKTQVRGSRSCDGAQTEKRPRIEFYPRGLYIYWFDQRF